MRNWPLLIAAIWLLAFPAQARSIAVRSGEHTGFTRLVFYTTPEDMYEIARSEDGYLLSIASDTDGFNLSHAFERINRTRVKDLTALEAGKLMIHQGCVCHIKELRLPSGLLVLDIVDGHDPNAPPAPATKQHSSHDSLHTSALRASLPLFTAPTSQAAAPIEIETSSTVSTQLQTSSEPPPSPTKIDKQALLERLAQAASQGLIDANIDPPEIAEIAVAQSSEESGNIPPTPPSTPDQHVRMQTATDQARADHSGDTELATTEPICLPDEQFNIASWGSYKAATDAPIFETSSYLGEFDHPNADLLVSHIRQTLYLTLGLEALQLIKSYGDNLPDAAILYMMAEVIENGEASSFKMWSPQIVCNTRGALWAALAHPALPDRVNTQAVLRSFSELPPHLRRYLAPALARKFLNANRVETAIEIRNMAQRADQAPSETTTVLDADINLAQGQYDQAHKKLSDTIQSDLSETTPAIVRLIQSKLQNGNGISDSELSLLASVAFEHKGNGAGSKLQELHIKALLHMGRFSQAFELMDQFSHAATKVNLLADASRYLVSIGSDAELLTYALTREDWDNLPEAPRRAMARRLKNLGFAEQARLLVLSNNDIPNRATRELLAEIALEQNKPGVALGYLSGLKSDNANTLRQTAAERTATALSVTVDRKPPNILRRLDLSGQAISEDMRAFLDTMPEIAKTDASTDLQTYQSILNDSEAARASLDTLLTIIPDINDVR